MRILAVADIHGVMPVYDWLAGQATEKQVDLIVLAGDLSAGSWEPEEQRAQAQRLAAALKKSCNNNTLPNGE